LLKDLGASLSDSHIGVGLLGDIIMRLPIYRELWSRALRLAGLMLIASSLSAVAQTQKVLPTDRGQVQLSFAPVVKSVTPAVVNVYASRVERQARNPLFDDPIFRQFFGGGGAPSPRTAQSLGSGVIVESSGLVVTNNHVIEGMTDVRVALSDKREFDAEIVLRDPRTDLAILKMKGATSFPVLPLGDSDGLEVGDLVLAIGNPFGVGQTVTQGIVSALARTQVGITDYGFFIQTDAAINPGNSGGALVDLGGQLVGINSAIYSRSGGSIGIGFAIPVNMVKVVLQAAKSGGTKVRRPWVGASLQNVTREIADSLGLDRPIGVLVSNLVEKSPAQEAGLKLGDVIVEVDGQKIDDPEAFGYRLATKSLGGTATMTLLRNGKKMIVAIKLIPAPETPLRETLKVSARSPFNGAILMNLSPAVAEEFSIESAKEGVAITEIVNGSIAAEVGLQTGDIIVAINDTKILRTGDVQKALERRQPYWKVTINRNGQVVTSVIGG